MHAHVLHQPAAFAAAGRGSHVECGFGFTLRKAIVVPTEIPEEPLFPWLSYSTIPCPEKLVAI
jgi:hypothetical protein